MYFFLIFFFGVGIIVVFVIIVFVIILKVDKKIGDIERINGGRGGWYMGNGGKFDENKNLNMVIVSVNLIIIIVLVIFFFFYFMIMFIRLVGVDMWRGVYSICLILIVLIFILWFFIYLFWFRMFIKVKEKNIFCFLSDKKRILVVLRKGKWWILLNDEKKGDFGELNYLFDEWSEYDEEKGKICCFFLKLKRYDEKYVFFFFYEFVFKKVYLKFFFLKWIKDKVKLDKLFGDFVFKKLSFYDIKFSNDDVNDDEMLEFYLDGNLFENEFGKIFKNWLFDRKNNNFSFKF